MIYFTEVTKLPTEHRTLMITSIVKRYKILRLVIRVTLEALVGFLLKINQINKQNKKIQSNV